MTVSYLYVALGSAIGGMARYWCSMLLTGSYFPYGTIVINGIGSFLIGCFAALSAKSLISSNMQKFLMIGICGGYTTFSSFSLETLILLQKAEVSRAMVNILLSVVGCLSSVFLGYFLISI